MHPSHLTERCRGIIWCRKCGCYTSRWPRELRAPCKERPASEAQYNCRRRLEKGLAPTTAAYLEDAMDADTVNVTRGPMKSQGKERHNQHGLMSGGRNATVGLYLRLPGGPLARRHAETSLGYESAAPPQSIPSHHAHRDAHHDPAHAVDAAREVADDARANVYGSQIAQAASRPTRYRIRGKSSPPGAAGENSGVAHRSSGHWCQLASGHGWTRRLNAQSTAGFANCHVCGGSTRMTCNGCHRRLCMGCAKFAIACESIVSHACSHAPARAHHLSSSR